MRFNLKFVQDLIGQVSTIPDARKRKLDQISRTLAEMMAVNAPINLLYVCTHNSRRSHFGQVAATLAASYFGLDNIHCFSAGTEITAMSPNAVNALVDFGFSVSASGDQSNPLYTFKLDTVPSIQCFSKRFDDASIPKENVIAIMTCTDAEQNCPFIAGAKMRISLPYEDPKQSDGSGNVQMVYAECFQQILIEALYVFSGVQQKI